MVDVSDTQATFLYVVGPTATGKSQLAIELASELGWPIVNCDSVQVFDRTLIGTAQPTVVEQKTVPHYLFGYVQPPKTLTAADYLQDVVQTLQSNQLSQCLFVGGSGFYIQALEKGLYPESHTSEETKNQVEEIWQSKGVEGAYLWITERDSEFAKKISVNDHYRVRRAMEVMLGQNKTMTELKHQLQSEDHSVLPSHRKIKMGINCERSLLRPRVEKRTQAMLATGWIDEVKQLRAEGLGSWHPMLSVGYKEVQAYLDGKISLRELPEKVVTATMQLIKKQQTWFKRDSEVHWFEPSQLEQALQWAKQQTQSEARP